MANFTCIYLLLWMKVYPFAFIIDFIVLKKCTCKKSIYWHCGNWHVESWKLWNSWKLWKKTLVELAIFKICMILWCVSLACTIYCCRLEACVIRTEKSLFLLSISVLLDSLLWWWGRGESFLMFSWIVETVEFMEVMEKDNEGIGYILIRLSCTLLPCWTHHIIEL